MFHHWLKSCCMSCHINSVFTVRLRKLVMIVRTLHSNWLGFSILNSKGRKLQKTSRYVVRNEISCQAFNANCKSIWGVGKSVKQNKRHSAPCHPSPIYNANILNQLAEAETPWAYTSIWGGGRFKSRPRHWLTCLGLSVVLLLLSRRMPRKDFKSGHDQFISKKQIDYIHI
jgi:hypothetical protein